MRLRKNFVDLFVKSPVCAYKAKIMKVLFCIRISEKGGCGYSSNYLYEFKHFLNSQTCFLIIISLNCSMISMFGWSLSKWILIFAYTNIQLPWGIYDSQPLRRGFINGTSGWAWANGPWWQPIMKLWGLLYTLGWVKIWGAFRPPPFSARINGENINFGRIYKMIIILKTNARKAIQPTSTCG